MRISDWSSDVCSSDLQRLVLQPRVELNLSAQDVPENRLGSGLTNAELGLRLRYEITRQFAPYIGVSYDAKTGRTADFARADGEDPTTTSFVAGVRLWRSEEHTSELQSLMRISYAVFCLKKTKKITTKQIAVTKQQ